MITRRVFLGAMAAPLFAQSRNIVRCGIPFEVVKRGGPRRYLFIHGDEFDAHDNLLAHMKAHRGNAYLVTGKTRIVEVQGARIDPNRMFSRVGAQVSLRTQNPGIDAATETRVLAFLDREREKLLAGLKPGKGSRLFAVHNNREYSVNDEVAASDSVSLKQPDKPRHFFLCVRRDDFELLKQSPYNVVLQTKPDPDDGSLSRLSARRGWRYINLEGALGERAEQFERMQWLETHLP